VSLPYFLVINCILVAITLKKLSLIWLFLLLLLAACHDKAAKQPVDQWADYRKAYSLLSKNDDSAFYYFNRAATNTNDKQQIASAYQSMAFIQTNAGDNYGAQESLTLSLKALDEHKAGDRDYLARDYNGLGMSYSSLDEYEQALIYYRLAFHFANDSTLKANVLNNEGNAYKDLKNYPAALTSFAAAIRLTNDHSVTYARVLTNQAIARWLADQHYNAAPDLLRSLAIRLEKKDVAGENSSYAHLAQYYMTSQPDSAIRYAQKMLSVVGKLRNGDDQLDALGKLILLTPTGEAKSYFKRYQQVEDSIETKRNAAKNQFAVIRYNVAKEKAENLLLQRKSTERRYQLLVVLSLAALVVAVTIWWYRRRRQRLQQEAEKEIRESRLQLSQKVHDQVANGIYSIMSEVEHSQELDKTTLIDKLDSVYEVSRNIAHDEPGADDDFTKRINSLLNAFKRPAIRLAVSGNEPELWQLVSKDVKQQLELVLQELMVNMSKHSQATLAHISFVMEQDYLKIECRDNGVGMTNPDKSGKGLKNTVSRIKRLNGSVTFETQAATGFGIFIHLPLALS